MRIFVTGGTGLIGRAVISQLAHDVEITVLTRDRYGSAMSFDPYVRLVTSLDDVDFNEIDCVINLAGEPIANKRWTRKQKKEIEESRWVLTERIAIKIQEAEFPPDTFISGSAIGFYGRQDLINLCEKGSNPHDEFSHRLCEHWEQLALVAASEKTRVVTLRTGIVLSNQGGALGKLLPQFLFGFGGKVGDGQQYMSWIHIADVVNAIECIMNNKTLEGPVNLTAPYPVTNAQFSKTLARTLKRPCALATPAFVLRAVFGEMADLLVYGQHVIPQKLMDEGFKFKYSTLEEALEDLTKTYRKSVEAKRIKPSQGLHKA